MTFTKDQLDKVISIFDSYVSRFNVKCETVTGKKK